MAAQQTGPNLGGLFAAVDTDKSGAIDATELQSALSSGGWREFSDKTARMLIRIFDADRSGSIGYQEFCYLWDYLTKWKAAFDHHDQDRSGTISFNEAYKALSNFGYRLSEPIMQLMFYSYDADRTGALGFDEFVQMNSELSSMTNMFRKHDTHGTGVATINYEQFLSMVLTLKNLSDGK